MFPIVDEKNRGKVMQIEAGTLIMQIFAFLLFVAIVAGTAFLISKWMRK